MKLGVCCAENGFSAVGKSGFSYAEIATAFVRGKDNASILELRKRAEENGLTIDGFNGFFTGNISLYNDPIDKILDFSEEAFNAAAVLGASYCVVGSGAYRAVPEGMDREKAYDRFMNLMDHMGKRAAGYGVEVILEPLRKAETNLLNTFSEGLEFCRAIGNPNVGCLVDFYHFFMNGEELSVFDTVKPGELRHVHIARPDPDRGQPKAEDAVVLKEWADALKRAGYSGRVSVECAWKGDFEQGTKEAYANLDAFR